MLSANVISREIKLSGSDEKFLLQPLLKAHLYSDYEYEIGKTGSSTAVWGMLIIATLIIVIAWVNYINLTTARSMNRAKEVGIRKVSGATRPQLIRQFLTESLLMNMISLVIALPDHISCPEQFQPAGGKKPQSYPIYFPRQLPDSISKAGHFRFDSRHSDLRILSRLRAFILQTHPGIKRKIQSVGKRYFSQEIIGNYPVCSNCCTHYRIVGCVPPDPFCKQSGSRNEFIEGVNHQTSGT